MKKSLDPSAIKALAIDLDGTALLPDNTLGDRTVSCLKKLIGRGIRVIICTGRAVEASRIYFSAMGAHGPMVFFNGAVVADVPDVKIISSAAMGLDVIDFGVDIARSMDVHFQAFFPPQEKGREMLLIEKQRPESEMYRKHTGIEPTVCDMKAAIQQASVKGAIKAMFITDPSLHDAIRQKMLGQFDSRIYITRTYPTFLEIMAAGVSKGEGLKTVMKSLGLKPQEVMAFGDEENDLHMFSAAGFCAAPSSAKDTVQQAADFVFGPSSEEGMADFMQKLFFAKNC